LPPRQGVKYNGVHPDRISHSGSTAADVPAGSQSERQPSPLRFDKSGRVTTGDDIADLKGIDEAHALPAGHGVLEEHDWMAGPGHVRVLAKRQNGVSSRVHTRSFEAAASSRHQPFVQEPDRGRTNREEGANEYLPTFHWPGRGGHTDRLARSSGVKGGLELLGRSEPVGRGLLKRAHYDLFNRLGYRGADGAKRRGLVETMAGKDGLRARPSERRVAPSLSQPQPSE
jgi:hypothetical protein